MREHRHARFLLHARDQALAAARNDDVDRRRRGPPACDRRRRDPAVGTSCTASAGKSDARQGLRRCSLNGARRVQRLRAAAQDHGVARLHAERRRVRRHVRPALVDDADDADGHAHARDLETVGPRPFRFDVADGIGEPRDGFDRRAPSPCTDGRRQASAGRRRPGSSPRARAASMSRALAARISSSCARHAPSPSLQRRRALALVGLAPARAMPRARPRPSGAASASGSSSALCRDGAFMRASAPCRRDGSSRRGHGSRGWFRFHRFSRAQIFRASSAP